MAQIIAISIIVVATAICMPLLPRLFRGRPRLLRVIRYTVLAVYVLANLYFTLLNRAIAAKTRYQLEFLWSYRQAISVDGGGLGALIERLFGDGIRAGIASLHLTDRELFKQIILNVLLYVPLGYLLPFVWPQLGRRGRGRGLLARFPWRVVLIGFGCSALTELTQLTLKLGWFEFDDILNNTIGCLLGAVMYMLLVGWQGRKRTSK